MSSGKHQSNSALRLLFLQRASKSAVYNNNIVHAYTERGIFVLLQARRSSRRVRHSSSLGLTTLAGTVRNSAQLILKLIITTIGYEPFRILIADIN